MSTVRRASGPAARAACFIAAQYIAAHVARAEEATDDWRSRPRVEPADEGGDHAVDPGTSPRGTDDRASERDEDKALALPRALLTPPRLVLDAALLPVRGLLYLAHRYKIPDRVIDLLYNDERTAAIIPTLSFFGSEGVTVGVTAFHEGWGRHHERVAIAAKFGGHYTQAYEASFEAPNVAGSPFGLDVMTRFEMSENLHFFGYGPGDLEETAPASNLGPRDAHVETTFSERRGLIALRPSWAFGKSVRVALEGIYNQRDFGPREDPEHDPSIETVYDVGQLPGFTSGYALMEGLLDFRIDTRAPKGPTSSGLYLDVFGGGAPPQHGFGFAHYGAEATGYIDLYHGDRILALHFAHEGVAGDDAAIPFADLPRLGGPRALRGFDRDRFRDNLTALATIEYQYPVHEYLSASLFVEMGSVGHDYLELVTPENYRFSGGGGLFLHAEDTKILSLQFAYGEGFHAIFTTDPLVAFSRSAEEL